MNKEKQEWDKHLTPKLGISDVMQRALDWWHELPIQNLQDMNDSWVGYLWKYYPDKSHPYHLTGEEVQHIYENEHAENLNISDVSDSFVRGQFYTKHYKNGDKMIFKYKGKSTDKDMIKVYMFCGNDGEEYGEDTEVTISKSGTGEGSYIEKSTKEDIEFLNSVSQNYH